MYLLSQHLMIASVLVAKQHVKKKKQTKKTEIANNFI